MTRCLRSRLLARRWCWGRCLRPVVTVLKELYAWIPFTFPFNATGQPAFSLPNGFNAAGLPIGLQIVGRQADEFSSIQLAAQFEKHGPGEVAGRRSSNTETKRIPRLRRRVEESEPLTDPSRRGWRHRGPKQDQNLDEEARLIYKQR